MKKTAVYLRLSLFIAGMLVGLQLPGFVDQYGKSLEAHYLEAGLNLGEFQDDADKFFSGSLEQLIQHYLNSNDPVFVAGGESVQAISERHDLLGHALKIFQENVYSPYLQAFIQPASEPQLAEIQQEVWSNFTHNIMLDGTALGIGVFCGIITMLLFSILCKLFLACGLLFKKGHRQTRQSS